MKKKLMAVFLILLFSTITCRGILANQTKETEVGEKRFNRKKRLPVKPIEEMPGFGSKVR
jgi:hypothetical protein